LDADGKSARPKVTSMTALCERYIEVHVPKKRSGPEDERRIKSRIKPEFGERDIRTIRYADIEGLHKKISKTRPVEANRVLALLSKMFNLAMRWELIDANPCSRVEKNREEPRQRYLSPEELEKLIAAIDKYEAKAIDNRPTCDAIRLLILTGARKMEALSARWDMFELGVELPKWVKPSSHTKQKKIHYVPLSDAAIELIKDLRERRRSKVFLFPGSGKAGHMTEIKRAWKAVRIEAGLTDFRIHDIRHSFAAMLASSGASLPIIGRLLGHTQAQTTKRYEHFFDEPIRAAVNAANIRV
jgi:integrase